MKRGANRDLLQWTLMTPADLPLGEHHYELQLNLGNSFPDPLKVPVVIRVLHPIQLSLDRVFFGIFCEGEEKTVDVSLRDLTLIDLSRLVVRSDNPLVLAEKREDEKLIRLILSPSIPPGQFKGSVSLSLADSKVPELLLPYSGIVQTGQ